MKVEYIFSNNKKVGSRIISWAAKYENLKMDEVPSHVAVLLNGSLVIESTFSSGVRFLPYSKWSEINNEVTKISRNDQHRSSKEVFEILSNFWGKDYDWKGIGFFALSYIRLIVFKEKLPESNPWQSSDKYFCTELIEILSGHKCSMHSPAKLLSEWTKGVPVGSN